VRLDFFDLWGFAEPFTDPIFVLGGGDRDPGSVSPCSALASRSHGVSGAGWGREVAEFEFRLLFIESRSSWHAG
jgi:hypothetical protein